ncbi:hypothetical protein [Allisonella histaminiformans]|uniref:hypothetical protein n=1 Tax=Allisonella histaminiformans TaxID=209880 RepID=UPI000B818989|nr:hypothetical protein [Allisonella histaminiformans]MDD6870748.1 hypothetical protein [Allisonella histaminiformans]PWL46576.1 MAG: hypothetical protein DBY44_03030 [Veillonellaceae bacterium]
MEINDFIMLWIYSQCQQAIAVIFPFSPERSSLMCLPVLFHKLADKQEYKLQGSITFSKSYIKNAKAY